VADLKTFCKILFEECNNDDFGFIDPWLFEEIAAEDSLPELTESAKAFKVILERVFARL
jgi:hypothetical protein